MMKTQLSFNILHFLKVFSSPASRYLSVDENGINVELNHPIDELGSVDASISIDPLSASVDASASVSIDNIATLNLDGSIVVNNEGLLETNIDTTFHICPLFNCFKWCPFGYLIGKDNCLSCDCAPLPR